MTTAGSPIQALTQPIQIAPGMLPGLDVRPWSASPWVTLVITMNMPPIQSNQPILLPGRRLDQNRAGDDAQDTTQGRKDRGRADVARSECQEDHRDREQRKRSAGNPDGDEHEGRPTRPRSHGRRPELAPQGGPGGPDAAHPVDPAARRSRGRAQVDPASRGGVWIEPGDRAGEELSDVLDPGVDVAADVVRVLALEVGRQADRAGQDAGRGSPGRTARPGPRSDPRCRAWSHWGRGRRPSRCACPPAHGSGRSDWPGRRSRTVVVGDRRGRPRPRPRRSRPGFHRHEPFRPDRHLRRARESARRAPSQP